MSFKKSSKKSTHNYPQGKHNEQNLIWTGTRIYWAAKGNNLIGIPMFHSAVCYIFGYALAQADPVFPCM